MRSSGKRMKSLRNFKIKPTLVVVEMEEDNPKGD